MEIRYKTLSEQLYADSDYLTELANKPSMRKYCQDIINATVNINRAAFQLIQMDQMSIIDKFVDHLIKEQCQGCTECEPRLPSDWKPNFACLNEGRAKWLLDEAERFKKGEK